MPISRVTDNGQRSVNFETALVILKSTPFIVTYFIFGIKLRIAIIKQVTNVRITMSSGNMHGRHLIYIKCMCLSPIL